MQPNIKSIHRAYLRTSLYECLANVSFFFMWLSKLYDSQYISYKCTTHREWEERMKKKRRHSNLYHCCVFHCFRLFSTHWNLLKRSVVGRCICSCVFFFFYFVCFHSAFFLYFIGSVCFVSTHCVLESGVFVQFVLKLWFLTSQDSIETLRSSVVCGARFCKVSLFCFFFSFCFVIPLVTFLRSNSYQFCTSMSIAVFFRLFFFRLINHYKFWIHLQWQWMFDERKFRKIFGNYLKRFWIQYQLKNCGIQYQLKNTTNKKD